MAKSNRDFEFRIQKHGDTELLDRVKRIVLDSGFEPQAASVTIPGAAGIPLGPDLEPTEEESPLDLLSKRSLLISQVHVNLGIPNWYFRIVRQDEPGVDKAAFRVQHPLESGEAELIIKLQLAVDQHLTRHAGLVSGAGSLPKAVREHIQAREIAVEQQIQALSVFSDQFSERITESEKRLSAQFDEKRTELEAEIKKRRDALDERQEKLEERSAELDAKDAQHARRQLRKDLKLVLEQRATTFALTEGTRKLRRPLDIFVVILLLVFGTGFVGFSIVAGALALQPDSTFQEVSLASVRALAFAIGFGLTSIYYIRWQQNWFDKHAVEEFQQKRFDLDLDRASWLVETALDWRTQTDQPMPPLMMERLSEGLFSKEGKSEDVVHPSDQLASALLGASAEAELQIPGGSKLRLDRKGIKRLQDGEVK